MCVSAELLSRFCLKSSVVFLVQRTLRVSRSAGESGRLRRFKNYLHAEPMKTGINLHRCIISLLPTSSVFFRSGESHTLLHTCLVNLSVSQERKKRRGSASFFKRASHEVRRSQRLENHRAQISLYLFNSQKVCATPLSLQRGTVLHGQTEISHDAVPNVMSSLLSNLRRQLF